VLDNVRVVDQFGGRVAVRPGHIDQPGPRIDAGGPYGGLGVVPGFHLVITGERFGEFGFLEGVGFVIIAGGVAVGLIVSKNLLLRICSRVAKRRRIIGRRGY
jgi:hypothetical protein